MTEGKAIYSAIPAIISEVGCVAKGSKNQQQGYMYRSADDVCDALHDALGKHKVTPTCAIESREASERASKSGGVLFTVVLKCRFTFWGEDGSSVATEAIGEAMDSADKATNKAMTAAYKYALLQVFCLMGHEDADQVTHEPTPAKRQPPKAEPPKQEQAKPPEPCKQYMELRNTLRNLGCHDAGQANAVLQIVHQGCPDIAALQQDADICQQVVSIINAGITSGDVPAKRLRELAGIPEPQTIPS